MAQYNFEGDLEYTTERQLEFINNVITELGYANSKVLFEPVGVAGDNYAACVKRIIINGDNGNLNMIAKIAPSVELHRQMLNSFILFRNEHIMYTEVLPKLVQIQIDVAIPKEEQLRYAKCYGSLSEPPNEVILLEDLKTSHFTMLDRFSSLSNECVKSVLKNFAVLHSLSYVLRYKEPEIFDKFKTSLVDVWSSMALSDEMKNYFQGIEDDTIKILNDSEHVNLLKNNIANIMTVAAKLSKSYKDNKYTVIQQGDSWTNNIMFKLENNKSPESIMIDYQLSKNGSPASDIMYMIFNCTDYESRKKHFYDWIDYYHTELEKSLSNYNLKVNFIYPRDRLDADLKRHGKLMFGISVCLSSMLIRKSADVEKLMDTMKIENVNILEQQEKFSVTLLDEDSMVLYKNKIFGLIDSFMEFGLL